MPSPRINLLLRSPYLPESRAFFARAGVTDSTVKRRHDRIVRYLKSAGLWSSLYLWYGADAGAFHDIGSGVLVPAADGQSVRQWLNRKGDYLHANQTTGTMQPLLTASGGANGLPAIASDGVDDGLEIANDIRIRPGFAICAFGKDMGSAGSQNRYIIGGGTGSIGSPSDLLIISNFNPSNGYRLQNFDGSVLSNDVIFPNPTSGERLITHVYNGANSAAYATGLSDATGAMSSATSGIGPALMLFRSLSANTNKGWYNHIFLFRSALTKSHHTGLETVLFSP